MSSCESKEDVSKRQDRTGGTAFTVRPPGAVPEDMEQGLPGEKPETPRKWVKGRTRVQHDEDDFHDEDNSPDEHLGTAEIKFLQFIVREKLGSEDMRAKAASQLRSSQRWKAPTRWGAGDMELNLSQTERVLKNILAPIYGGIEEYERLWGSESEPGEVGDEWGEDWWVRAEQREEGRNRPADECGTSKQDEMSSHDLKSTAESPREVDGAAGVHGVSECGTHDDMSTSHEKGGEAEDTEAGFPQLGEMLQRGGVDETASAFKVDIDARPLQRGDGETDVVDAISYRGYGNPTVGVATTGVKDGCSGRLTSFTVRSSRAAGWQWYTTTPVAAAAIRRLENQSKATSKVYSSLGRWLLSYNDEEGYGRVSHTGRLTKATPLYGEGVFDERKSTWFASSHADAWEVEQRRPVRLDEGWCRRKLQGLANWRATASARKRTTRPTAMGSHEHGTKQREALRRMITNGEGDHDPLQRTTAPAEKEGVMERAISARDGLTEGCDGDGGPELRASYWKERYMQVGAISDSWPCLARRGRQARRGAKVDAMTQRISEGMKTENLRVNYWKDQYIRVQGISDRWACPVRAGRQAVRGSKVGSTTHRIQERLKKENLRNRCQKRSGGSKRTTRPLRQERNRRIKAKCRRKNPRSLHRRKDEYEPQASADTGHATGDRSRKTMHGRCVTEFSTGWLTALDEYVYAVTWPP
jgi:hypothetical protein